MNELALFAGAGGGILAGKLLGWNTICAVEQEPYPITVLAQRQNEGLLSPFPIWSDIRTFDGKPWNGIVDVVSGGFPCQDISSARTNNGGKAEGLQGEKSGLWFEMLRVIKEVEPRYAFIENSSHLRTKGLNTVLEGLAEAGYNAAWGVLSAKDCGANHERKRMWILAERSFTNSNLPGKSISTFNAETQRMQEFTKDVTYTNSPQCEGRGVSSRRNQKYPNVGLGGWWETTPELHRMDDGVAFGMDRLKAIGNGQVPIVAATAFLQLKEKLDYYKENYAQGT